MISDIMEVVAVEDENGKPVEAGDLYDLSIQAIETCYVEHTNFDVVLKTVLGRISRNRRKSGEQRSVLVEGHSEAGKTTLTEKIEEAYPPVKDARRVQLKGGSLASCDYVPVVSIICPDTPQRTDILRLILAAVGDPLVRKRKSRPELETAVHLFFRALGTLALVVDEAQRPTDREGELIQRSIATLFQQIHDQGVIVVLVGLGRARALQMQDEQVGNRWSTPLRIDAYRWGDPEIQSTSADFNRVPLAVRSSRIHFIGFVIAIASEVKLSWASDINFSNDKDAFLVFFASLGLAGNVKKLFMGAVEVARETGITVITWAILAEAFERECRSTSVHAKSPNPFYKGFQRVSPGELPDDGRKLFGKAADALTQAIEAANKKTRARMLAEVTSPR